MHVSYSNPDLRGKRRQKDRKAAKRRKMEVPPISDAEHALASWGGLTVLQAGHRSQRNTIGKVNPDFWGSCRTLSHICIAGWQASMGQ